MVRIKFDQPKNFDSPNPTIVGFSCYIVPHALYCPGRDITELKVVVLGSGQVEACFGTEQLGEIDMPFGVEANAVWLKWDHNAWYSMKHFKAELLQRNTTVSSSWDSRKALKWDTRSVSRATVDNRTAFSIISQINDTVVRKVTCEYKQEAHHQEGLGETRAA